MCVCVCVYTRTTHTHTRHLRLFWIFESGHGRLIMSAFIVIAARIIELWAVVISRNRTFVETNDILLESVRVSRHVSFAIKRRYIFHVISIAREHFIVSAIRKLPQCGGFRLHTSACLEYNAFSPSTRVLQILENFF